MGRQRHTKGKCGHQAKAGKQGARRAPSHATAKEISSQLHVGPKHGPSDRIANPELKRVGAQLSFLQAVSQRAQTRKVAHVAALRAAIRTPWGTIK